MQLFIMITALIAVVLQASVLIHFAFKIKKLKQYNERLFIQLLTYQHVNKLVEARLTVSSLGKVAYRQILAAIVKDETEALKHMPEVYAAYRKLKGLPATE